MRFGICFSPSRKVCLVSFASLALLLSLSLGQHVQAQLEITEVMFNPLSNQDNAWEWIEVRNTGGSAVDLDGAFAARVGDGEFLEPAVDSFFATNTVIPAGGVAVIYDANLGTGNPSNYNDQQFRDAWGLGAGVPLIGASRFPALTNGGTAFGFWASQTEYENVLVDDGGGGLEVGSLDGALIRLDYSNSDEMNPFPASTNGVSMEWNGTGDYLTGTNWAHSADGVRGAVTSTLVSVSGSTNSTEDVANPGVVPAGTAAAGLLITEIMYNPRSEEQNPQGQWEWVEIYNNTGSTIDFGATPYVLDDDDNGAHSQANITSGSVADDAVAVLFNGDHLTQLDMIAAWDPGGANGTNFIAVTGTNWTGGFSNGGDTVAIWDDFGTEGVSGIGYLGEDETGSGRTTANAVSVVDYDDDGPPSFPFDDGDGSIYLTNLSLDQNTGANWMLSFPADGISFNASALAGTIDIHPGGDVGSPGSVDFGTDPCTPDLNGDTFVDGVDLGILLGNWGMNVSCEEGNINSSVDSPNVDSLDLGPLLFDWSPAPLGAASVPEPSSIALFGLAMAFAAVRRRR